MRCRLSGTAVVSTEMALPATASPYGLGLATTLAPLQHTQTESILNRQVVHFSTGVSGPLFNRP
jgi:hypothetical protein